MAIKKLFVGICLRCPLCRYTRSTKSRGIKYYLFRVIEFLCPICRVANLPLSREERDEIHSPCLLPQGERSDPPPCHLPQGERSKSLSVFLPNGERINFNPAYRSGIKVRDIENEFEIRYPLRPLTNENKEIENAISKTIQKNLQLLRSAPNRPSMMSYYEEVVASSSRLDELKKAKERGNKVVGTFCNFVPLELLYACGIIPIRLCAGTYETISPAEEVLPRDICPLIKSSFGFKLLRFSYFELCDLVIVPTTCDGKKKLGEILNDYIPVWMLEVPNRKNANRINDLWLNEIRLLKKRLERFSGVSITRERLKQAIRKLHERQTKFRQLYELRKHNPPLINGRDALLVVQASFYDDIDRWTEKTEKLCAELSSRTTDRGQRTARLLLTGAPVIWPNFKVLNIIEELGATVVVDELCSGTQALYDPVEVDEWTEEAMLRAIANRYLLPSTCPCFTESNDRLDKLLRMIEEFKIDGVIYHSLRLCQLYDIESYKVRQVLRDRGIPVLNIHTDYSQEDIEQIRTRVEAFLEMLGHK